MRILRGLRRAAATRDVWASVLQVAALVLTVVVVLHFLGLWWALLATAAALVLISLGLDRGGE